jgi:WavE lipopolysaccharide synthesis
MTDAPDGLSGTASALALDRATRRLFDRSSPVIGWGTGSVFEYFHTLFPIRLDYLVDSDASRWGALRHGVEVVSPERIRADGADPFIVIYSSAWPEIQRAIRALGPFASLPASAAFADASTRATLAWSETLMGAPVRPLRRADHAVVVQGPVVPDVTLRVLRSLATLNPDALLVLSTWNDTPASSLAAVAPYAHEVVTSARPEAAGIQNRNYQIVSTRAGLARAMDCGASLILKTRSDLAVLADDIFAKAGWWLAQIGDGAARAYGAEDRLIVPSSYTRKYLLYHPSDMAMLGRAADLWRYWGAPLDARGGSLLSDAWMDRPLTAVNLSGNPTESYLGLEYCRAIGRPVGGTLRDSWAFYRDLFAVVDNDWFDLLWYKNLSIPDAAVRAGVRQTASGHWWRQLLADERMVPGDVVDVDPEALTLRALTGAAL